MKAQSEYFPKYNQLTLFEKLVLKTCCYFPPKKRRERALLVIEPQRYIQILTNAYGNDFWQLIENKKVLDFGCGEGGFVIAMASNSKGQFEGVDIQDEFEVVNAYVEKHQIPNVKFHIGNSKQLENNSYDLIISHDSFEHFENPDAILKEMARLLKPNGYILIKFGPTWMSPYGRHMSGTYKKSKPWVHLIIPEKNMMRVHSVYHNDGMLYEKYSNLIGGLNKMTIAKAKRIISKQNQLKIEYIQITAWRGLNFLTKFPLLKELFGSGVYIKCKKI